MTIAAGFVCSDGLVLFADTEEQQGYIKTNVEKIRQFSNGGINLVLANAGNGYLADALVDRIFDSLQGKQAHQATVIAAIRNTIIEFHRDEVSLYPSDDNSKTIGIVIGVQLNTDAPFLLHADASALRRVSDLVVIGMGAEIKYLAQQLYREKMPLKHGVVIANHLCKTAKDHVQGCGGQSRIATMRSGEIEIRHFFDVFTDELIFSALSDNYRAVLLSIGDGEITDEQFQNCLEWFIGEAWRARTDRLGDKKFNDELKVRMKTEPRLGMLRYYEPVDPYLLDNTRRSLFLLQQHKQKVAEESERDEQQL